MTGKAGTYIGREENIDKHKANITNTGNDKKSGLEVNNLRLESMTLFLQNHLCKNIGSINAPII